MACMTKGTASFGVPDPREIFLCAEAFRSATQWLAPGPQARTEMWWSGEKTAVELAAPRLPYIICEALRVEFYLKCLYVIERNEGIHGHDVCELFKSLKPETRQAIEEKYKAIVATDGVRQSLATVPEEYRTRVVDLSQYIELSRRNFENMRYAYERPMDNMGGFPCFGDALRETILLIRPEWA